MAAPPDLNQVFSAFMESHKTITRYGSMLHDSAMPAESQQSCLARLCQELGRQEVTAKNLVELSENLQKSQDASNTLQRQQSAATVAAAAEQQRILQQRQMQQQAQRQQQAQPFLRQQQQQQAHLRNQQQRQRQWQQPKE